MSNLQCYSQALSYSVVHSTVLHFSDHTIQTEKKIKKIKKKVCKYLIIHVDPYWLVLLRQS